MREREVWMMERGFMTRPHIIRETNAMRERDAQRMERESHTMRVT